MAVLVPVTVSRAGLALSGAAAAGGGDSFPNTGKEVLVVTNGGVGSINVTLDVQTTIDGNAVTDPVVAVGAGATKVIGPFPTGIYNDGNSRMNVTYSGVTSVTVQVLTVNTTA